MLKDDVALYSKLTGNDGMNTPIAIIGAYLDGYERGKASAQLDTYWWKEQCQSYEQTINKLRESLSTQPEIIRCCECKYLQCNMRLDGYLPKGVDEFECRHWCGSCDPMDFCSYAERREVTT